MKIEKISENQIRCTLTREDLEERHMKLSELAYGTDKAKDLFREMMRFASTKYGFETDDIPLMIEAVPISSEMIILIITKVDYPEELDTRYANFSEDDDDFDDQDFDDFEEKDYDQDLPPQPLPVAPVDASVACLFRFPTIDVLFQAARSIAGLYDDDNSLYKRDQDYFLILHRNSTSAEDFNKVCNILSEYGSQDILVPGGNSYFQEHYQTLIGKDALQHLATM